MFRFFVLLLISLHGAICLPKPSPAQDVEDRWCIGNLIIGHCLPRPDLVANVYELNVQMNADGTFANQHDATISATTGLSANNQHRITVNFAHGFTPAAHSEVHIQIEVNNRIYNDPARNYIDLADGEYMHTFSDGDWTNALHVAGGGDSFTIKVSYWAGQELKKAESMTSAKEVASKTSPKEMESKTAPKEVENKSSGKGN